MPRCRHKEAVCVIGDFWTCKTPGCKNGPKPEAVYTMKPAWTVTGVDQEQGIITFHFDWPPVEWDEDAKTPVSR